MGHGNCAVIGCKNSTYRLKKWRTSTCYEPGHNRMMKMDCGCSPPFQLFAFPSVQLNFDKRKIWIQKMNRVKADKSSWVPVESDRVCSVHFVDGFPTVKHPSPELELGYDPKTVKSRRAIIKHDLPPKKPRNTSNSDTDQLSPLTYPVVEQPMPSSSTSTPSDEIPPQQIPSASLDTPTLEISNEPTPLMSAEPHLPQTFDETIEKNECLDCKEKDKLINTYEIKIDRLTKAIKFLRSTNKKIRDSSKPFSLQDIKTDEKMKFYTGIESILLFQAIFNLLEPYIPSMTYWRGPKKVVSTKVKRQIFSRASSKKLNAKTEFLLTLMKLRLGLLTEDLADRFQISVGTCSETIKTWIRFLAETLGTLVKWVPKEAVMENMPKQFKKAGCGNVRVIIDCSEIFIERPKNLEAQAVTWSDYKSHNTLKFLIGITPTGFISFLSECYGGRASDKFICKDSGFF
ncbi:uncharacterized protein [Clytia hemisphaerica]|uniref:uncharacterized protein n=1 Tax=Clytia hemisphaerica TaxID=252671 RepID=UPI0034D58269